MSKPDPRDYIRAVSSAGSTEWFSLGKRSDSFRIDTNVQFSRVLVDPNFLIIIELEDEDLFNHDTIGTVELNREKIADACGEDGLVWIPTMQHGDALASGVVAVKVSVMLSR